MQLRPPGSWLSESDMETEANGVKKMNLKR